MFHCRVLRGFVVEYAVFCDALPRMNEGSATPSQRMESPKTQQGRRLSSCRSPLLMLAEVGFPHVRTFRCLFSLGVLCTDSITNSVIGFDRQNLAGL